MEQIMAILQIETDFSKHSSQPLMLPFRCLSQSTKDQVDLKKHSKDDLSQTLINTQRKDEHGIIQEKYSYPTLCGGLL